MRTNNKTLRGVHNNTTTKQTVVQTEQIRNVVTKEDAAKALPIHTTDRHAQPVGTNTNPKNPDGMLMTTYTTQTGKKVMMPRLWTIANFGKNILAHNSTQMVSNVVIIGKTGSGKTVTAKRIIHDLHTRGVGKGYIIKWFSEEDMIRLPEILPKLKKTRNYIMVWDDISFIEKKYALKQKQVAEIASLMATLRHKYLSETSHLINFSLIHYTKAVGKGTGFRQGDFTVATSVTQNEKMNFYELFDKYALDNFSKMYRLGLLKGKFKITADSWSDKTYDFYIKDVHPVIVNEVNHPHPMLVDKLDCEVCGKDRYNEDYKVIATAKEFIEHLPVTAIKSQGRAIKLWCYLQTGDETMLKGSDRWVFKLLNKVSQYMTIPVHEILEELYPNDYKKKNLGKDSDPDEYIETRGRPEGKKKYIPAGRPIGSLNMPKDSYKFFETKIKQKGKKKKILPYIDERIKYWNDQKSEILNKQMNRDNDTLPGQTDLTNPTLEELSHDEDLSAEPVENEQ